ncbi:MAG: SDR family NAD(P)-dependent oxidoreductase [Acidobacteria bacterium]|nr:SDR family NAD(P)-dependent oxidoreductase [Acidobacteriota bacterium]
MTFPTQNADQAGRVWFITGTSTGFGRSLAEAVLEHGDRLIATARDTSTIDDLARAHPERARVLELDVTDRQRVHSVVEEAPSEFGRLDVVVNNAGYGLRGALEELPEEEMRAQFETNVFGVLNVTRAALPHLRRQRSGHIVQMSSVGGVVSTVGGGIYAGTKFAVEGVSEALAKEVAHLGIKVTLVEPGPFRTDFAGRSMRRAEPMDDYAESVGHAHERFLTMDGSQPNDPARGARAIIQAVEAEDPPLRLPLGPEAFQMIRAKLDEQRRELDVWKPLGAATAFITGEPTGKE